MFGQSIEPKNHSTELSETVEGKKVSQLVDT
jgi:hypothetical protein